jgi:hypothetical protein
MTVAVQALPPSAFEMSAISLCARTLLPASSSGGQMTAMPDVPGETAMMPSRPSTSRQNPRHPGRPRCCHVALRRRSQ